MKNPTNASGKAWISHTTLWLLIGILCFQVYKQAAWRNPNLIAADLFSYYAYLPATIIREDPGMNFLKVWVDQSPFNELWSSTSETGQPYTKMPMGWASLNLPFFLGAHSTAGFFFEPSDGFSTPYRVGICLATLFYAGLGLLILRRFLDRYFHSGVVAVTLVILVFGTNLWYYIVYEPGMSHPLNFFLFAAFLAMTRRWHERPAIGSALVLGLLTALVALTRASNIILIIVFILYGVQSRGGLVEKFRLFMRYRLHLVILSVTAALVMVPQFLYWHLVSGNYLFYSYADEHFFFSSPHLLEGLFGFRKGWLVYTPILLLPLISLFFRQRSEWSWGIRLFTVLNIYIVLSWWCWWYGGSFGNRAFIESCVVLSLPLAWCIDRIRRRWWRVAYLPIILLICLSVYQTLQYKRGVLHYDSMTWNAYRSIFLRHKVPDGYQALLCHPDYYNAKLNLPERDDCIGHDHFNP